MPIIRPHRREWLAKRPREQYVDQLATEIQEKVTTDPRPTIFEVPMDESGTYHIIVVWDEWEDIPLDERASIVTEAYAIYDAGRAPEDAIAPRITAAIGATVDEVIQLGLLPYQIVPTRKGYWGALPEKVRQAMVDKGAIELPGGHDPYLAFPSRQMAEEAFRHLTENVPEGHWHRSYE